MSLQYGNRFFVVIETGDVVFAKETRISDSYATQNFTNQNGLPLGYTVTQDFKTYEATIVIRNDLHALRAGYSLRECNQNGVVTDGPIFLITTLEYNSSEGALNQYKINCTELVFAGNTGTQVGEQLKINADFWNGEFTLTTSVVGGEKLMTFNVPEYFGTYFTNYQRISNVAYFAFNIPYGDTIEFVSGDDVDFGVLTYKDRKVVRVRTYFNDVPYIRPVSFVLKYTGDSDTITFGGCATTTDTPEQSAFDEFLLQRGAGMSFSGDKYPYPNGPYILTFVQPEESSS